MIIAVANLSECSGISALAVRLAHERAHARGDAYSQVLLVTTSAIDPMHEALDRRGSSGSEAGVLTAVVPSPRALQMMVPRMAQDYDDIVIDMPGINTPLVRTSLAIAERVVVPVPLSDAEVGGSTVTCAESDFREFVMTVDMARYYNPQLRVVAVADRAAVPDWLAELLDGQPGWSTSGVAAADPVVASVA